MWFDTSSAPVSDKASPLEIRTARRRRNDWATESKQLLGDLQFSAQALFASDTYFEKFATISRP